MKASVIIPVRTITPYVRETVAYLKKQAVLDFEIIVVTDAKEKLGGVKVLPSNVPTPSFKRNLGAKQARGEILAFLDDDSYPDKNWLKNALAIFGEDKKISAVCGPALTPPFDNVYQKASGWVWASWLGSGGAGVYRNRIMPRREVDDFPSVNLLVRKKEFERIGGFDTAHWPGEDTKLCLDLTKAGGKIIYDPGVLVYHHRRAVLVPHLKQISRYALRRGYFARIFPQTSFRIGYFIPSFFVAGILAGGVLSFVSPLVKCIYFIVLSAYLLLLAYSFFEVYSKEKKWYLAFLVSLSIIATHLVYGPLFIAGFLQKKIATVPHKLDPEKKVYVGG